MLSPGSPEVKLKNGLRDLYCAESNFADMPGVPVRKTRLIEGLAGRKNFAPDDAKQMLEVLEEMRELQAAVGDVPVDWSRVDRVQIALVVRRAWKFDHELNGSNDLDEAAKRATESVKYLAPKR